MSRKYILLLCLGIIVLLTLVILDTCYLSISVHHVHEGDNKYVHEEKYAVMRSLLAKKDITTPTVDGLLLNATESGANCHCTCLGATAGQYDSTVSETSSLPQHSELPTASLQLHHTNSIVHHEETDKAPSNSAGTESLTESSNTLVTHTSDTMSTTAAKRKHYLLFVAVLSQFHEYTKRNAVRQTWMKLHNQSSSNFSVVVKFVIGTMNLSTTEVHSLNAEENIHHDLLFLPQLVDGYKKLTHKVLHTLVWVDQTLSFSYLLKCDLDTFVALDRLAKELSVRTSTKDLYWGYFVGYGRPVKKGRYPEHNWFLCDNYLPYALGGGYVISSNLVHRLAVNSDGLQRYVCEDVSVGVWLSPFEIERKHDVRFNTGHKSRGCNNQHLVTHKQSPEEMHKMYNNLLKTGVQCETENSLRHPYVYNWNTQPTKCCTSRH